MNAIKPSHYLITDQHDAFDVIKILCKKNDTLFDCHDYSLYGQALQYLFRCGQKNGLEDIKKAIECLNRLVEDIESRDYCEKSKEEVSDYVYKMSFSYDTFPEMVTFPLYKSPFTVTITKDDVIFAFVESCISDYYNSLDICKKTNIKIEFLSLYMTSIKEIITSGVSVYKGDALKVFEEKLIELNNTRKKLCRYLKEMTLVYC